MKRKYTRVSRYVIKRLLSIYKSNANDKKRYLTKNPIKVILFMFQIADEHGKVNIIPAYDSAQLNMSPQTMVKAMRLLRELNFITYNSITISNREFSDNGEYNCLIMNYEEMTMKKTQTKKAKKYDGYLYMTDNELTSLFKYHPKRDVNKFGGANETTVLRIFLRVKLLIEETRNRSKENTDINIHTHRTDLLSLDEIQEDHVISAYAERPCILKAIFDDLSNLINTVDVDFDTSRNKRRFRVKIHGTNLHQERELKATQAESNIRQEIAMFNRNLSILDINEPSLIEAKAAIWYRFHSVARQFKNVNLDTIDAASSKAPVIIGQGDVSQLSNFFVTYDPELMTRVFRYALLALSKDNNLKPIHIVQTILDAIHKPAHA